MLFFFVYSQQILFEWRHLDYRGCPGCCRLIEFTSSYNFLKKNREYNILSSDFVLLIGETNKNEKNEFCDK